MIGKIYIKSNSLVIIAAIATSVMATAASAQTVVIPQDVLKLPVGTLYALPNTNVYGLTRTPQGFTYKNNTYVIPCNNVTKSGGHGNATLNCKSQEGFELRFEWIDMKQIKFEAWQSMASKAGQKQNKPGEAKQILTRR